MHTEIQIVHYLTQAEVTAGAGTALSGGQIEIIDATTGQPTGVVYTTGAAGSPVTVSVTANNINTVLSAAGGAGWEKSQATAANYAITRPTSGASLDLHIESGGTLAALSTANWAIPANGVDQLKIRNFSGVTQTLTVTTGAGQFAGLALTVPEDSNPADSSYTIPAGGASYTPTLLVTIDPDGWVQAQLIGAEVSEAELITSLAPKADVLAIEKSLLWNPANMVRAIDLDFESLADGTVASITNTGSLGGTAAQTTAAQQPIVGIDTATNRRGAAFDGTDDWLESSAIWSLGTSYGIFAVVRLNSKPTAASMIIGEPFAPNNNTVEYALEVHSGGVRTSHFNGTWRNGNTYNYTNGDLVVVIGNYDGVNLNLRAFGTDSLSAQTSSPSGTANGNTRIGRRWDGTLTADNMTNMRLFRVVAKAGAFTADEMNNLEAWAIRHFGLDTKVLRPVSAHVHSAATTTVAGFLSTADKTKLDGVATGAEVNVNADWNATSGDTQIVNKPTLGTASPLNVPATGNASTTEVVKGNDARLSDNRTPTAHTHAQSEITNLTTDLAAKQVNLVSGTSIKTVGGTTVLGSGDIPFPTFATSLRLMTPTDIIEDTDRAIYLLADDLTTGAVTTWANPGTGGDFTQATAANQPTVSSSTLLGNRKTVLFDGTTDFMEASNISLGTRYGLFAVFVPAALANQFILSESYASTVEYTFGLQTSKFFSGHFNGGWRMQEATTPLPVINTPYIMVAGYDGANITVKIDGGTVTTAAQTSDPTLTDAGNIRLGRRWDGTTDFFNGHIACVVAKKNAYFTATEIAQLEGWSAWYYGRVSTLPSGHTYKNTPPLITA